MSDAPIIECSGIWKTKALERHLALRLNYQRMLEWYDVVVGVTNAGWTAAQTAISTRPGSILADVHPIYRFLNEGTDTALVQICELGLYLEAFRTDPAYPTIATDLISPKFASTVFELAMAYRWRRAGGAVELQSAAAAGRIADFCATISDVPFLIEASNIAAEAFELLSFRAPLLIKRTASSYLKDDCVLVVRFQVPTVPDGTWEQALVSAIKNCCYEVSGPGWETRRHASKEFDGLRIDVERFSPGEVPDATQEDPWDVRADQITEEKPHKLLLRILVRLPSGDIDCASRIIKKLIREMKQLSGVRSSARVVLLDITGIEPNALQLRTDELREGLRREITKKPALACVWLLSRMWTTEMRYAYWGLYVPNPNSTYQLPQSFLDTFVSNERSWDFLSETEIRHTTEEDARRSFLGRQPTFEGYIDSW
jgi:hypothetical protein